MKKQESRASQQEGEGPAAASTYPDEYHEAVPTAYAGMIRWSDRLGSGMSIPGQTLHDILRTPESKA